MVGNHQERALQFRVGGEVADAAVEPRIHPGIGDAQLGLQFARVSGWIVDQESRINAEEFRQQLLGGVR